MRTQTLLAATLIAMFSLTVTGCRVEKHGSGDHEDVKIATPFGGMSVKTDDAAVMDGIGLPIYPGAVIHKKDKDNSAADIDMSFGSFKLRVKAAEYTSPASPAEIETFYRKALTRYGTVIDCVDDKAVGPARTPEGLTCDTRRDVHLSGTKGVDISSKHEMKAGSEQHQHIVAVDADGAGTKFGLVALDLPGHLTVETDEGKQNKGDHVQ